MAAWPSNSSEQAKKGTTGTSALQTTSDMIGTLRLRIMILLVMLPSPHDSAAASVSIIVVSVIPAVVWPSMPAVASINIPSVAIIIPTM